MSADMTSAAVAEAARKKWGSSGVRRIPIDLIGAYPENRGKLGVSPWHVHEVYVRTVRLYLNVFRTCCRSKQNIEIHLLEH